MQLNYTIEYIYMRETYIYIHMYVYKWLAKTIN